MERFYYKKSRLNQLRGFCITVQEGCSARKAAFRLNLEPATVTVQIRTLEEELGVKLFKRTRNHRLKITKEGRLFYNMAVLQLQGTDSLFTRFHKKLKETNENSLRIVGENLTLAHKLPKYLKKLMNMEKFKNAKIELCDIKVKPALGKLRNKEADLAFYTSRVDEKVPAEFEKQNIFKFNNVLVMHKDSPLAKKEKIYKADIAKYSYLWNNDHFYDPNELFQTKRRNNIVIKQGTWELLRELVKEGLGISDSAEIDVLKKEKSLVCKNINHLSPKFCYSVFTLKNSYQKDIVKTIIDLMKEDSDID